MAINNRQTNLLVAENWKKIYQTFQEADFTSYDFETLRKTMIDYLRLYYPEDFNDFTESSEFIALIDLIAFMGQSLAFRTDLNARENFIDTAERRDSVLKLARLLSYNPKRNICASGYLKVESIVTTENVFDSNGLNLSNLLVSWNDQTNDNWLEQFTIIINAALVSSQIVGKPGSSKNINGIDTEEYSLNLIKNVLGVYSFQTSIEGNQFTFEAVSASTEGRDYIYESSPSTTAPFNILYRNDNYGNASNNTGFFVYFKQGTLASQDFSIIETIPNRVVPVNYNNINNTDVWLYKLDANGSLLEQWEQVPTVTGINVIYNDINERNLFQVNTRAADQVDLVFGDGSFANMPNGDYRVYFRTSNGLTYKITPDEMKNINIPLQYISRDGRIETITLRASLQYTVNNASGRETSDDIKQKAPQQYYTQNRMITGEDYNILPYTSFGNVLKVKSVNRTSSGLSRFLDIVDSTGKYSSTNIFAEDGVLFRDNFVRTFRFSGITTPEIIKIINQQIIEKIASKEMLHFYYANYPSFSISGFTWSLSTIGSNEATGYFITNNIPAQLGGVVRTNAKYIRKGAVIRFRAQSGNYFDPNNNMISGTPQSFNDKEFIYATITEVFGDGTNNGLGNFDNGTGPVTLNIKVPKGAVIDKIYPVFKNSFTSFFVDSIVTSIQSFENFGLTYNLDRQNWEIISEENLNNNNTFDLEYQRDTSGQGLDNSWLIRFAYSTDGYTVHFRGIEYIFHSVNETTFFFDDRVKIYDSKTGTVLNDQVRVLKTNSRPDSLMPLAQDINWYVYKSYVEVDGYVNKDKIFVTFSDSNNDGIPDNPELFNLVVGPEDDALNHLVFFQSIPSYENFVTLKFVDNRNVVTLYSKLIDIENSQNLYTPGQLFYAIEENKFYSLSESRVLTEETQYIVKFGRQNLAFQYRHNSPNNRRIDPSSTNVTDIYLLTNNYERDYRNWIQDTSNTVTKPSEPTNYELSTEFGSLNDIKSISDTIVFNSAKFKLLFGSKAPSSLQATFKVIKNPNINVSDNDIKTSVISAINTYFDIANWEFGETFYFSELSAYLHRALSPNVASILIVPTDSNISFGGLYQINAEPDEIIISAATVENIEIISAVTANQLNLTASNSNKTLLI
jgi:hypothetical protein